MTGEAISIIIAVAGLAVSLGGIAVAFGRADQKIKDLEKRQEEDRAAQKESCRDCRTHNNDRFSELYESRNEHRNEITEVTASVKSICERLDRIEPMLMELLQHLPKRRAGA